jgi:hypothetical protein
MRESGTNCARSISEMAVSNAGVVGTGRINLEVAVREDVEAGGGIEVEEGYKTDSDMEPKSASGSRNTDGGTVLDDSDEEDNVCGSESEEVDVYGEQLVDVYGEQLVDNEIEVRREGRHGQGGRIKSHVEQSTGHDKVSTYKSLRLLVIALRICRFKAGCHSKPVLMTGRRVGVDCERGSAQTNGRKLTQDPNHAPAYKANATHPTYSISIFPCQPNEIH